ncbi:hypothetical protein ABN135_07510 [Enterobacter hormaechei]|uniref:hypothetical protein n=1 Tax=Enterobacter hormaechei TaxID=158836 RepID=UPI0032DB628D
MNKLFRFALIFASSFCETAWAGIVGVVFSAMTGHSEVISVLAKRTCSLLEMPTWGVGGRRFKSSRADQKHIENQALTAGFFMSIFCTGNNWGKTGEKCRQKIRHNKLIATDPFVRLYQHATSSNCPILSV